jgi:hypothetical protein
MLAPAAASDRLLHRERIIHPGRPRRAFPAPVISPTIIFWRDSIDNLGSPA